jgi:pyridinium-3,5-bisthiocarboxylic acid mononucleotide nickel chelatase
MSGPSSATPPSDAPPSATPPSDAPPTDATIGWFHCFAGIAGDMALGSLIDAGADVEEIRLLLQRLSLPGWELRVEQSLRGGVACTRALVAVGSAGDTVVRTHAHIVGLITGAALPPRVADRALAVFRRLAEVESALHRRPVDQVHFHEVGGHDALIDIVGTAAALEVLGVDEIAASAVATGTGTVRSAHGILPNPSPAAVRLLEGIPTYGRATGVELTTPTGAALLAALSTSFGPMPAMVVAASGFGGGASELDELPNCTQVVIGHRVAAPIGPGQPALVLETNLDDVTGEQLAHAVAAALDAGAFDAWVSPVTMKKGRPGHVLHVLTDATHLDLLRQVIHTTTGTFGVRAVATERWPAARSLDQVTVDGMEVRMKVGYGRAKPEFEDVALIAAATGMPVHEVASRAEEAWRLNQRGAIGDSPGGRGAGSA